MTKATLEWDNWILTLSLKEEGIVLDQDESEVLIQMLQCALQGLGFQADTVKNAFKEESR